MKNHDDLILLRFVLRLIIEWMCLDEEVEVVSIFSFWSRSQKSECKVDHVHVYV
jgi:hypothetical protein